MLRRLFGCGASPREPSNTDNNMAIALQRDNMAIALQRRVRGRLARREEAQREAQRAEAQARRHDLLRQEAYASRVNQVNSYLAQQKRITNLGSENEAAIGILLGAAGEEIPKADIL